MPILKKEFEIGDQKIEIRQASGIERLKFESILAKTFRNYKHFGFTQSEWTEEQQEEFMIALETAGGGMEEQVQKLIPPCLPEGFDINMLDRDELMLIYNFVRGDNTDEGAPPLDS